MKPVTILSLTVVLAGCYGEKPTDEVPTGYSVLDFAFLDESTIFARAGGRSIQSHNGGESWSLAGSLEGPASQYSIRRLQLEAGVDGSIWAVYAFLPISDSWEHTEVVLSRDGGPTFELIASGALSAEPDGYWELLVERHGADPLVLEGGGQLWAYDPSLADAGVPLVRFGVPIPSESPDPQDVAFFDDATECNNALIATGSYQFQSHIWTSADSASAWTELPDSNSSGIQAIDLACDGEDELWAVGLASGGVDNVVYRYEFDNAAWIVVAEIPEFFVRSFAAHGGVAYVAGEASASPTSLEGTPPPEGFVYRMNQAGDMDRLGGNLGDFVYRVRVDSSGVPWVCGSDGLFKWNQATQTWDQVWP